MKPAYAEYSFTFKALSDSTRLQILDILSCGELCACDILETFQITQPTLSYHMKILVDSSLVKARKESTWVLYSLNKVKVDETIAFFTSVTQLKDQCICNDTKNGFVKLL